MKNTPSRLFALLAATLVLGSAPLAFAQSKPNSANTMANPSRIEGSSYIGLSGGPSDFSRITGGNGLFSHEDHNTAYSATVGNYVYNQNLGVEIGYTNYGQVNRGGGSTKAEGVNLSVIGRLPLSDSFNLLGKVGTTYGHTEVSASPLSGMVGGSESGFDWSYGVGAELVITPQWSAVLQYDEAYMKFAGGNSERVSTTTIGARMRF